MPAAAAKRKKSTRPTSKQATKKKPPTKAKASPAVSSAPAAKHAAVGPFRVTGYARTILYANDWETTHRFYAETLGLPAAYPSEEGWAEFNVSGTALCLHGGRIGEAPSSGVCSVSFTVRDLDAAAAALKARGVAVSDPASPCAGLRYVSFRDPSGNELSFEGV